MKKKILTILLIIIFLSTIVDGNQGWSIDGNFSEKSINSGRTNNVMPSDTSDIKEVWNKTYGGINSESGLDVKQTSDGGYIIAGATDSFGNGGIDIYLIKTNSTGGKLWEKTFGSSADDLYEGQKITVIETSDGYLIAASIWIDEFWFWIPDHFDFYIIKTDFSGNIIWDKIYGGGDWDNAHSVISTTGGYVIAGQTASFGAGDWDAYIIKIDSSGNIIWDQTYGGTGSDFVSSIQRTTDGGYILGGSTTSYGTGGYDYWLIKINSDGDKIWDKTFGDHQDDMAWEAKQTTDGGYVVGGQTLSYGNGAEDAWIIKTNSTGYETWNRTWGGPNFEQGSSLIQAYDSYFVSGITHSYGAEGEAFIIKFDNIGNKIWNKTIGGSGSDWASTIIPTINGGLAFTGYTNSYGVGGDVWLVNLSNSIEENRPPVASFKYYINGLLAKFNSTSFDPDGDPLKYQWDFGDGTSSSGENVSHYYELSGKYKVILYVNDSISTNFTAKNIIISSNIESVSYPTEIAKGLPLKIRIKTIKPFNINLTFANYSYIKYGNDIEFNIDTSNLSENNYELLVALSSTADKFRSSIKIYDPEKYQKIVSHLDSLEKSAINEMHEISYIVGYDLAYFSFKLFTSWTIDAIFEGIKRTIDATKNNFVGIFIKLKETLEEVGFPNEKLVICMTYECSIFIQYDKFPEYFYDALIGGLESFEYIYGDQITELPSKSGENIVMDFVTKKITEPYIYFMSFKETEKYIKKMTDYSKNEILRYDLSEEDINRIVNFLKLGEEAIKNTNEKKIYIWDVPYIQKFQPSIDYYDHKLKESLNPPTIFTWPPGKLIPKWLWEMVKADTNVLTTFPAYFNVGWTPEEFIGVSSDSCTNDLKLCTLKAVSKLIKYIGDIIKILNDIISFASKISSPVIMFGQLFSSWLLSWGMQDTYKNILNDMLTGNIPNANSPIFIDNGLYIPKENIIITITPDGKIIGFDHVKKDIKMIIPEGYKIVSLNSRTSYQSPDNDFIDISMNATMERNNYTIGDIANITVKIKNNMTQEFNDTILWIYLPQENITINDVNNIPAKSNIIKNYSFLINNSGLHISKLSSTYFTQILSETYTSFTVGGGEQKGAVLTLDHDKIYDPGKVKINVTIQNLGNEDINPTLLYNNISNNISTLKPKEYIMKTVNLNYINPDTYNTCFILKDRNDYLDSVCADYMIKAIDTLIAFPNSNKPIYNLGENVNITVDIKNITLDNKTISYKLEIFTPTGKITSNKPIQFIANKNGTYIVKSYPIANGYQNISGETLFIVEKQSDLNLTTLFEKNTTIIYIKTDNGRPVEGANVIINGIEEFTNKDGTINIEYFNQSEIIIKAEKFGFNPVIVRINRTDFNPPSSIRDLKNITYRPTYINWSWKDPIDSDFQKVMIYINGIFKGYINKGIQYYNTTGIIPNTTYKISTRTVDTSGNINMTWLNKTSITARDNIPPNNVTYLKNVTYKSTYIKWTWKDPIDIDFTKVIIYINGTFKGYVNKGIQYYNSTNLLPNKTYKISTRTIDTSGNIGNWANNSAKTARDYIPPASIYQLKNITYKRTYINWTWKDPTTFDFDKIIVYLNGKFKTNITKGRQFYNVTGLINNTWYKISTHTIDTSGNVNKTWVNKTARTAP